MDYRVLVNVVLGIVSISLLVWSIWKLKYTRLGHIFVLAIPLVGWFTISYGFEFSGYVQSGDLSPLLRPFTGTLMLIPGLIALVLAFRVTKGLA